MIAEIIPGAYDAIGRKVMQPDLRHRGIHPTFPMGRYVSQPLTIKCETIRDVRKFLATCRGVSDKELFGKDEYWQPPEHFEKLRKGDCEDFALWTWRQLMAMGYDARVVFGRHGRYGIGHAWVSFQDQGKTFLVERQYCRIGNVFPRLSTLKYHPKFSVAWDGRNVSFYSHAERKYTPSVQFLVPLVAQWAVGWGGYTLRVIPRIPAVMWRALRRRMRHGRTPPTESST